MKYRTELTESSDLVWTDLSAWTWNERSDRSKYHAYDRNKTPYAVLYEHQTDPPGRLVGPGIMFKIKPRDLMDLNILIMIILTILLLIDLFGPSIMWIAQGIHAQIDQGA